MPATIPSEMRMPLKMVGNNGWINDGSESVSRRSRKVGCELTSQEVDDTLSMSVMPAEILHGSVSLNSPGEGRPMYR